MGLHPMYMYMYMYVEVVITCVWRACVRIVEHMFACVCVHEIHRILHVAVYLYHQLWHVFFL